jgi:hypothetical protein
MSQVSTQHPAVVLRSHYVHVRALLATAAIAVVCLSLAVVVLATDDGTDSGSASSATPPTCPPCAPTARLEKRLAATCCLVAARSGSSTPWSNEEK